MKSGKCRKSGACTTSKIDAKLRGVMIIIDQHEYFCCSLYYEHIHARTMSLEQLSQSTLEQF